MSHRIAAVIPPVLVGVALFMLAFAAFGQSTPNFTAGQIPTPAQWNSYFGAKQDLLGYTAVNKAGDTMLGKLVTAAPASAGAGLNLPEGAAPGSPNNGDIWLTSAGAFVRIEGTTNSLLTSAHTATLSAGFTYTSSNLGTITTGTVTLDASSGNYQYLTRNGAFTLASPHADGQIALLITNGASAGTLTFSGFSVGSNTGDSVTTTNTSKFIIYVTRIAGSSTYQVKALQ